MRFDLDRMEVAEIEDHGPVPFPPKSGNYTAAASDNVLPFHQLDSLALRRAPSRPGTSG
ncbi:MAG: hypothetical protein M3170_08645 [Candidatus Dormibacteraeota bacterium]|nr:hypothetical protein [Candidatus Dormibacteraeota bacterium]